MPDWFYRTVSRPILFRLSAPAARDLALGVMGTLARLPLGGQVIHLLGHMDPDVRLRRERLGITFPSGVGLACGLDMNAVALPALARFGFGFLEIGPVTAAGFIVSRSVLRRPKEQALCYPDPPTTLAAPEVARKLAALSVPLVIRIGHVAEHRAEQAIADARQVVAALAPIANCFSLVTPGPVLTGEWSSDSWSGCVQSVIQALQAKGTPHTPVIVSLPADVDDDAAIHIVQTALAAGARGVIIDGSLRCEPAGRLTGLPAREPALRLTAHLREQYGPNLLLIASGGIHEPEDALKLRAAGADLVAIDSGLVYSGPGLAKRINEAMLFAELDAAPAVKVPERMVECSWFWTALLGTAMLIGAILALIIASTRVVLPYDEAFVGMTREQLHAVNPRLLAFLTHDRVTLAGTMISLGVLYLGLSLGGIRQGWAWARTALLTSAFAGFTGFFLFLGFGYFDPFHAFVTAILFQLLLMALHSRMGPLVDPTPPNLREDWRWRYSQWGQFLFILMACGVLGAGVVISTIGATHVFVHEDLMFMDTTAEALAAANPRLVPLVAHDRATFGAMLVSTGIALLLTSLWGFRQGARWLWWTLALSGTPALLAGIGVHLVVGYTDAMHLAPAALAGVVFTVALALAYPYLCIKDASRVA